MSDLLANGLSKVMIKYLPNNARYEAVYVYKIKRFLTLINIFGMLLICTLLLQIHWSNWAIYCLVILLRSFAGGFHAKTKNKCLLMTIASYCLSMFLGIYAHVSWLAIVLCIVSIGILLILGPVVHKNLKSDQENLCILRRRMKRYLLFCTVVLVTGMLLAPQMSYVYTGFYTYAIVGATVLAAYFANRKGEYTMNGFGSLKVKVAENIHKLLVTAEGRGNCPNIIFYEEPRPEVTDEHEDVSIDTTL